MGRDRQRDKEERETKRWRETEKDERETERDERETERDERETERERERGNESEPPGASCKNASSVGSTPASLTLSLPR